MSKDNLTICACGKSNACYTQELNPDYTIHQCYGCGFTTNTLMTSESKFLEEQLEVLPELYKDLVWVDADQHYWMPLAVNRPQQGMVYADGPNKNEWRWAAVKSTHIPESDRKKYPIPGKEGEYYEHKMDTSTIKHFDPNDFIGALDYIGML